MSMRLLLVAPGLLALPAAALAKSRALSDLAERAEPPRPTTRGVAAAMFEALGAAADTPVAPLALLGAGGAPDDDYVLCADPVHLVADRDTVVLLQCIDDLSDDAATTLLRMLNAHFGADDLRFEAIRPSAWYARRTQEAGVDTTPVDAALGRGLLPHLPRGPDALRWRRWQNEIQMLLHDHPVNAQREARGESAVSGVWFWGGGRLSAVGSLPLTATTAVQGCAGDLARGIALRSRGEATPLCVGDDCAQALDRAAALAARSGAADASLLVVLPPKQAELSGTEHDWLGPALDLLARRRIDALHFIADGHGVAATWSAQPVGFWRRLSARMARAPFRAPEAGA